MKRYFDSFVLSIVLYITLFGTLVYFLEEIEFSNKCSPVVKESRMLVSLLCVPKQKSIPKDFSEKKLSPRKVQKKKKSQKTVTKTKIKKAIKKKTEPIAKKVFKKQENSKPLTQELHIASMQKIKTDVLLKEKMIQQDRQKQREEEEELRKKQNIFFAKLREAINKNKHYPRTARRRNIQGEVTVKFLLLSNGSVKKIAFVKGHSIFKKSVKSAIEKSFPISVKDALFQFPKEFAITLNYVLR